MISSASLRIGVRDICGNRVAWNCVMQSMLDASTDAQPVLISLLPYLIPASSRLGFWAKLVASNRASSIHETAVEYRGARDIPPAVPQTTTRLIHVFR